MASATTTGVDIVVILLLLFGLLGRSWLLLIEHGRLLEVGSESFQLTLGLCVPELEGPELHLLALGLTQAHDSVLGLGPGQLG